MWEQNPFSKAAVAMTAKTGLTLAVHRNELQCYWWQLPLPMPPHCYGHVCPVP